MALNESFVALVRSMERKYRDIILKEQSEFRVNSANNRTMMSTYFPQGLVKIANERSLNFVASVTTEVGELQDLTDPDDFEESKQNIIDTAHKLLSIGSETPPTMHPDLNQTANIVREHAAREIREEIHDRLLIARDKHQSKQRIPEKWTFLFLQANPDGCDTIKTSREYREIVESIRGAKYRDQIEPEIESAVRIRDVIRAVNEYRPRVIHFSGHGNKSSLAFLDEQDNVKEFDGKYLADLIIANDDQVELVVFNSCNSLLQAIKMLSAVPHVVGTVDDLPDSYALIFSRVFYSAIGYGRSIVSAFKQAQIALSSEFGQEIAGLYELKSRNDCDAQKRILVIEDVLPTEPEPLSNEAKTLLLEASEENSPGIISLRKYINGTIVKVNSKRLCETANSRTAASWEDAVKQLIQRELLEERVNKGRVIVYSLSKKGYDTVDKLQKEGSLGK